MDAKLYLPFYLIVMNCSFSSNEKGVCQIRNESGNLTNVCCAEFEKKQSECKPCATGFTSYIGKMCRPCPPNTFGDVCSEDCTCSELQRCDNIVGCVYIATTQSIVRNQKTNNIKHDFTTIVLEITNSNIITTGNVTWDFQTTKGIYKTTRTDLNNRIGLSTREIIVYYILSAAVLILLVCLSLACLVILRHKKKRGHTINISNSGQNSTNQAFENNDPSQIEDNLYEVIDEADIIENQVRPDLHHNDYLEVVTESVSSNSSHSDKPQRCSYLNPYQPCLSTDVTKSSYEKLQIETMKMICYNDDFKEGGKSRNYMKLHNKQYETETLMQSKSEERFKIDKRRENAESILAEMNMAVNSKHKQKSYVSCSDLRKNIHSESSFTKKNHTL